MEHFAEAFGGDCQEGVDLGGVEKGLNANPDKLILPEGMKVGNVEGERLREASRIDSLSEAQSADLQQLKDNQNPPESRFEGERGNSLALPDVSKKYGEAAKALLYEQGMRGIEYHNGFPDFSKIACGSVTIPNMTMNRSENFKQAYKATADKWNREKKGGRDDWKASEVKQWKQENNLAIHEKEDLMTCEFVPLEIHAHFSHVGGIYISKLMGRAGEIQRNGLQQVVGGFYDEFDA